MHWLRQRVTVIETTPDHVVVLDRTTGPVSRELILGLIGTYHGNEKKRGRPRKTAKPCRRKYCQRCPDNTRQLSVSLSWA
jgi:hypothetical protein